MGAIHASQWQPQSRFEVIAAITNDSEPLWDLVVVGGGITGAGIYHEAAKLGLRVLLLEQKDFSWGTSSRSSKMVHGGLRYLGAGQFKLALESVNERQRMLREDVLVEPLPFIMTHYKGRFPGPFIFRALISVYDWMAKKSYGKSLKKGIGDFFVPGVSSQSLVGATQFGDAYADDTRLVMAQLRAGNHSGGLSLNYAKVLRTDTLDQNSQQLTFQDLESDQAHTIRAKLIVNATGAWVDQLKTDKSRSVRPLRGSHLMLPYWRLPVSFAISFLHPSDKRPVFAYPWEGRTVIGTTDLDHDGTLEKEASITQEEVDYLLEAANYQFDQENLSEADVISTWSGVRPVVSDSINDGSEDSRRGDSDKKKSPSSEKREHFIWESEGMISVAGGKLTTFRVIAREVLGIAKAKLKLAHQDFKEDIPLDIELLAQEAFGSLPSLSKQQIQRLISRYGVEVLKELKKMPSDTVDKVQDTDTLWAELEWVCRHEAVIHLDDLLLRRTRLGLQLENGAEACFERLQDLCMETLGWSQEKWEEERARYIDIWREHYYLPASLLATSETAPVSEAV